jgi:hypothetical protein
MSPKTMHVNMRSTTPPPRLSSQPIFDNADVGSLPLPVPPPTTPVSSEADVEGLLASQLEKLQLRQRTMFLAKLRPRVPVTTRRARSAPRRGELTVS